MTGTLVDSHGYRVNIIMYGIQLKLAETSVETRLRRCLYRVVAFCFEVFGLMCLVHLEAPITESYRPETVELTLPCGGEMAGSKGIELKCVENIAQRQRTYMP